MNTNRFSHILAIAAMLTASVAGAQETVYYNNQGQSYQSVQDSRYNNNNNYYDNNRYQQVTRNSGNFQDSEYRLPNNQRVSGSISIGVGNVGVVGRGNNYYAQPVYPQPVYTAPPVQYYQAPAPQYYAPQPVYTAPVYPSYPVNNYGYNNYNAPSYSQSYANPLPWIAVGGITTALIYESNRHHRRNNYYHHRRGGRR